MFLFELPFLKAVYLYYSVTFGKTSTSIIEGKVSKKKGRGRFTVTTVVLEVSKTEMEKIKKSYNKYARQNPPQGSLFLVKTPTCTITGYRSGKVMFQGKGAHDESKKWRQQAAVSKQRQAPTRTHQWSPPANIQQLSIIGSDECGTGDYFGPMTVAAVFASKDQLSLLTELGVKDSKQLTDEKIREVAQDLAHTIPYSLLILHNEKYNELQEKGMNQGKMKALLHNQALHHVINKVDNEHYDGILVDQFVKPATYFRYLEGEKNKITSLYFATQAEGLHLAVAAASIIARSAFLKEMDILSKRAHFTLPKGASKQVDEAAARLIRKRGEPILRQFTKLHFANTTKAKQLAYRS